MQLLYSMALAAAFFVGAPWWLLAMLRQGKYRAGLRERLGCVPPRLRTQTDSPEKMALSSGRGSVWVHAVSVGEVLAVTGLIRELQGRFPQRRVVVSTTTLTGQTLARGRFGAENVFYFPLDFAFAIRPYLQQLQPELMILAETEFWPNLLHLVHAQGARIVVVNARISDRSFPRYRRFRGLMRRVLGGIDLFLAQTAEDADRLAAIGADADRIKVGGNLKFDFQPPQESPLIADLRTAMARASAGPVLVAGSTVEGEEQPLLEAFTRVLARLPLAVLLLAPRHPERFASVAALVAASGLKSWRRSQWDGEPIAAGVFLLDSIGELSAAYALAQIAFVGGSLAPRGGHNILEPASYGVPVLVGPHTNNFRDLIALFEKDDAVRVVRNARELADTWLRLLADEEERTALGRRGAVVLARYSGATARTADILQELLSK